MKYVVCIEGMNFTVNASNIKEAMEKGCKRASSFHFDCFYDSQGRLVCLEQEVTYFLDEYSGGILCQESQRGYYEDSYEEIDGEDKGVTYAVDFGVEIPGRGDITSLIEKALELSELHREIEYFGFDRVMEAYDGKLPTKWEKADKTLSFEQALANLLKL